MAELIDRQAFRKELLIGASYLDEDTLMTAVNVLDCSPTVDAVSMDVLEQIRWERDIAIDQLNSYGVSLGEKADCKKIVYCKDCKYWNIREGNDLKQKYFCNLDDMWCKPARAADDFCSYGERREDDD